MSEGDFYDDNAKMWAEVWANTSSEVEANDDRITAWSPPRPISTEVISLQRDIKDPNGPVTHYLERYAAAHGETVLDVWQWLRNRWPNYAPASFYVANIDNDGHELALVKTSLVVVEQSRLVGGFVSDHDMRNFQDLRVRIPGDNAPVSITNCH